MRKRTQLTLCLQQTSHARCTIPKADSGSDLRLWYRQPAKGWLQALPWGNGRVGAMVFGGVAEERIVLNEDMPIDITKDFDKVVAMIRAGDYAEADAYITRQWLGRSWPCYQPLGESRIQFEGSEASSDYVRELDLTEAMCRVRYTREDVCFEREYFASQPDNLVVARFRTSKPDALNFKIRMESPHPTVNTVSNGPDDVTFTGQLPGIALRRTLDWVEKKGDQWKYPEIWNKDGSRKFQKQVLYGDEVDGRGMRFEVRVKTTRSAVEAVLLIAVATSFNGVDKSPSRQGADPAARNRETLARSTGEGWCRCDQDRGGPIV